MLLLVLDLQKEMRHLILQQHYKVPWLLPCRILKKTDHKKFVKQQKESEDAVKRLETLPHKDYSLPQGSTITVNLRVGSSGTGVPKKTSSAPVVTSTSGGLLAPPPSSSQSLLRRTGHAPSTNSTTPVTTTSTGTDLWGDFTSTNATPTPTSPPPRSFDFASFGIQNTPSVPPTGAPFNHPITTTTTTTTTTLSNNPGAPNSNMFDFFGSAPHNPTTGYPAAPTHSPVVTTSAPVSASPFDFFGNSPNTNPTTPPQQTSNSTNWAFFWKKTG